MRQAQEHITRPGKRPGGPRRDGVSADGIKRDERLTGPLGSSHGLGSAERRRARGSHGGQHHVVILDNYSTHKTPAIHKWLAAHPRFHMHFTPTSGSWLNLVERWFGELTARKLRRGVHRSVAELNADIEDWTDTWNEHPKPYVWVKTADEILDNLAGYCNTINASRH